MTETIETRFDATLLPEWAQHNVAVVAICKINVAFRCNVHEAQTEQGRQVLIEEAERAAR